jgi:hypothetical protein
MELNLCQILNKSKLCYKSIAAKSLFPHDFAVDFCIFLYYLFAVISKEKIITKACAQIGFERIRILTKRQIFWASHFSGIEFEIIFKQALAANPLKETPVSLFIPGRGRGFGFFFAWHQTFHIDECNERTLDSILPTADRI